MPPLSQADHENSISSASENSRIDNLHTEGSHDTPSNDPITPSKPHKALLRGFITLSEAEDEEDDMRARLQYVEKRGEFYTEMKNKEEDIRSIVASHCGLASADLVHVPDMFDEKRILWIHGSFNVCIPVSIKQPGRSLPARMAFRVPLPYKVGEEFYPGNCEEKLRSEAATYIWIGENCPDVPIPTLRGFGVPGGLSFFQSKFVTPWQRIKAYVWRLFHRLYGRTIPCDYIPQMRTTFLDYGYTLVDWIESEDEQMLSNIFNQPHTEAQTQNLYRDMARIIVSLAKVPQPRIGSWTISNDGQLSLSNRPLFCHLQRLENWNIPSGIARDTTYTSADTLHLDLLAGHDNRLRYQGNAVFSEDDARRQAVDLVLMRASLSQFTDRSLRDGPFVMHLTDMHSSNIFVDQDWNIKHIIDLEWACSLPLEHLLVPYWLTGKGVDQLTGPEYERFENCYRQFTNAIRQEEINAPLYYEGTIYSLAATMDRALEQRHYWYLSALKSPKGLFNLFRDQLQSLYEEPPPKVSLCAAVSPFWTPGMSSFVSSKLKDFAQYIQEVRDIFNSDKSGKVYIR
ncbi:hypothetical protein C8Q69DRAFT_293717 [Paecilomyces variotii]|uniref:Uncharacterized protein n=1 Tax=Byssochlamys spectabilis TaxID=264951 RepID=A0A443HRP2_BYSSP|nr:hypothetical protein C8Q69DRAFT_293717 [Paecilomyces variotii]KAJ9365557.1 hypothetical protein DTO280E4_526 [Paecilomyces variotii]RWQ94474.1 hypothetical protein C8Q69DRAFT_293717 [Paecilomyces variotii]